MLMHIYTVFIAIIAQVYTLIEPPYLCLYNVSS